MATDGDIDFTTYTREQLDSAVSRMDHARYPINSRKLIDEYQRRKVEEKKAAALALESKTVVVPDHMLSVARAFEVMFEPRGSFLNWLGPSRNDFHLIGSGTIRVDDVLVRVKGRRIAYWVGMPVVDTDELGRRFVVNVEAQGRAVRFELRVPGEKVRGVTVWLRTAVDAEELAKLLPSERTPDFTPQLKRHVEFERSLIAQSPKTPVTYGLVFICVFVYFLIALGTNHWFGFDGQSLLPLGSNFGPYTTAGDWWRLFTAVFLHLGVLHLAFNMWALASFGPLVERLYGSLFYALICLVAGIAGGLASVSWEPAVNTVGASGAIFGIFGALIAAQLRHAGSIPKSILRPLRTSSLIYIGFVLFAGLRSVEVDNAAHLGGLGAGFLLGLAAARPVTGESSYSRRDLRRSIQLVPVAVVVLVVGFWLAQRASASLVGERLYQHTAHSIVIREPTVNGKFNAALARDDNDSHNHSALIETLEKDVIPFWQEAGDRLATVQLPDNSSSRSNLEVLQNLADGRADGYQLLDAGLRKNDPKVIAKANQDLKGVEQAAKERFTARQ